MNGSSSNHTVSAWVTDTDKKEKLRIQAALRGMTLSRYCGLLLEKATKNYTEFDVDGHDETFPQRRKKHK